MNAFSTKLCQVVTDVIGKLPRTWFKIVGQLHMNVWDKNTMIPGFLWDSTTVAENQE